MADTESRLASLEKRLGEHIVHFATTIRDLRAELEEDRAARELMRAEFREQMSALREGMTVTLGRLELDVAKINRRVEKDFGEVKSLLASMNDKLGHLELDKE